MIVSGDDGDTPMMNFSSAIKGRLAYGWLWIWFGLVAFLSALVYIKFLDIASVSMASLPVFAAALTAAEGSVLSTLLKGTAGLLFCWRTVKVVVLHGSPFPFGLLLTTGRENNGSSGRPVHLVRVEQGVMLWFGAVLRAHPSSDKLVRSRLELLVLSMPFQTALVVQESRLRMIREASCQKNFSDYLRATERYMKKSKHTSTSQSLGHTAKRLSSRAGVDRNRKKRIDGLNWLPFMGGGWSITDDFGYQLKCEPLDAGSFKLTGHGLDEEEATVHSVAELRGLAIRVLHPT